MNFYKHHIGDFDQATRHLSFIEDAAYSRMIRKYYAEEKVLPVDVKKIERLIGARTREEREAVAVVLEEFFVLEDDGWHNKRCDEELAEAQESVSERDEKKANERERQKRHRAERKALFEKLRALDIVPAYDTSTEMLRALLSQRTSQPVTRDKTENVTREDESGNAPVTRTATANQTPEARLQTPDLKPKPFSPTGDSAVPANSDSDAPLGAAAVSICLIGWERDRNKAARGINASHPTVIELSEMHVTPDELRQAYDMAVADRLATDDPNPVNAGFVKSMVLKVRNPPKPRPKQDDWNRSPKGIERKASELGIYARPGESHDALRERCESEIRKRSQGVAA